MSKFSKFGERYSRPSGTLQLMQDLGKANASANKNTCMLGGGNPAHIPEAQAVFLKEIKQITQTNSELFSSITGNYDGPQGNTIFISHLCDLLNERYDWRLRSENICLTNGSQSSFFSLFNLLAGDMPDGSHKKILLPLAPEYIGYFDLGLSDNMFVAKKPNISLIGKQQFKYRVDFDNLNVSGDIAAICVSRPTNPSGNVLTDDEMHRLDLLAQEHNIPLIVDNAYGFPFPGAIFVDVNPTWHDNIILTMSLSKLGLPGTRTGIVIANTAIIQGLKAINAVTNLAPNSVGALLTNNLIKNRKIISLRENIIRPYYRQRSEFATNLTKDLFADLPVKIHLSEGAFFLWLWCDRLPISTTELYHRLVKRDVYVIPGEYFFPQKDEKWNHPNECLRVTFTKDNTVLKRGFNIIAEELKRAYQA